MGFPNFFHDTLSCASACQPTPAKFSISSLHLVSGLFLLLISFFGCQSVILLVHLLSSILATCPAHLHFCCLTTCTISFTPVFSLIQVDLFLSLSVIPSMALSMALCAILNRFSVRFVSFHVSQPYVMAGITHRLYILRFKHIGILLLSISWFFPNVIHPIFIRRFTSLSWSFLTFMSCPK